MDEEKGSFIHLCQPDCGKSCGACCGLYNYADSSRPSLISRLKSRTDLFWKLVRSPENLPEFAQTIKEKEDQDKLYEVIYCCEYLGFLNGTETRVGCLLHPLQNGGRDLRDASFYGKELCEGHFCPSYHYLSRDEKKILIEVIEDWYLYGLCVTDIDFAKEFFRLMGNEACESPKPERFTKTPLREKALEYFKLKMLWPFRSPAKNRFGKYYFDGSQYMIQFIRYDELGSEKSKFDRIFLSLSSEFSSLSELRRAEAIIQGKILQCVKLYLNSGD